MVPGDAVSLPKDCKAAICRGVELLTEENNNCTPYRKLRNCALGLPAEKKADSAFAQSEDI